jgi:hypothetical protein
LVAFKRGDLRRPARSGQVTQSIKTVFFKALKPLADTKAIASHFLSNQRHRFTSRSEKNHASTPIEANLGPLAACNFIEIFSLIFTQANSERHTLLLSTKRIMNCTGTLCA